MTQATDVLKPPSPSAKPAHSSWLLRGAFSLLSLALLAMGAAVLVLVSTVYLQRTDTRERMTFNDNNSLVREEPPAPAVGGAPAAPTDSATVWDGHGPVNILLLGLDQADCKYGPDQVSKGTRTDTMVLVRVDPKTKRVAMLSIPRDLLVSIPGHEALKINTAHVWGEAEKYEPGGGPGLLKEVIWENLGLQVHRFVRIDLAGFDHVLEILGGLDMDLPASPNDPTVALHDVHFPDGHCGLMTVHFKPGPQHLDPAHVMQYARSRYSTSDFDRNRRQQEVLVALKDRLLQLDTTLKAPQLLQEFLASVDSDFSRQEILGMALLAKDVKTSDIVRLQIDNDVIYPDRVNGQSVLMLKRDVAQEVIRRFMAFEPPPTPTPVPTRDPNATPRRRARPTVEATAEPPAEAPAGDAAAPPGDGAAPADGPTPEPTAPPAP